MPSRLKRYYGTDRLHFITWSCYHRQPWLASPKRRDLFLQVFEQVRQRYRCVVVGYVVMPEHVHVLIGGPERGNPSTVVQAIKQGFAKRVLRQLRRRRRGQQPSLFGEEPEHVWQRRFYDFNIFSRRKRIEKLRYMHRNPVKRGLVAEPEQWAWSSFRSYLYAETGAVALKSVGRGKVENQSSRIGAANSQCLPGRVIGRVLGVFSLSQKYRAYLVARTSRRRLPDSPC